MKDREDLPMDKTKLGFDDESQKTAYYMTKLHRDMRDVFLNNWIDTVRKDNPECFDCGERDE